MDETMSVATVILTSINCTVKQLDASTADCLSYATIFHEERDTDR